MPDKILACLEATAAEGTASAEIARQAAGRSSVRGAVADELIATWPAPSARARPRSWSATATATSS